MREQSLLRFITCGSVDDGKSTLIGRLLYESGLILEDQMAALEAAKQCGNAFVPEVLPVQKASAFMESFLDWPPSQLPASFSIDNVAADVNAQIDRLLQQGENAKAAPANN